LPESLGRYPESAHKLRVDLIEHLASRFRRRMVERRGFMPSALSRAVAKVASLFLAAISVALIRAGIVGMVAALPRKL
jgi:hypothetical protein